MNPKWLAIGLLGLSVTAAGAVYLVQQRAAQPAAASSSVQLAEAVVPAPAAAPQNSTTVAVQEPRKEPAIAATKRPPTVEPKPEPAPSYERPVSPERPVATERPVSTEPPVSVELATPPAVPAPAEPQKPRFDEVTVSADSVLGVSLDSTISSETAKVEDRVNARISRDVIVDGKVAVPSGARLEGVITEVVRGGKFKERARLSVTFQTLILADGTKISLATDPVFRDGEPPNNVKAKVGGGGAVGAILGAMIGGKKGAIIGGAAGAAGGAAAVAAGDRAEVTLISGSSLTVRLKQPITVLVERYP